MRIGSRTELIQKLPKDDSVTGLITNTIDFGVFLDLDGVEGLIHVSELSWGSVHYLSDPLSVGQEPQAKVLNVDKKTSHYIEHYAPTS